MAAFLNYISSLNITNNNLTENESLYTTLSKPPNCFLFTFDWNAKPKTTKKQRWSIHQKHEQGYGRSTPKLMLEFFTAANYKYCDKSIEFEKNPGTKWTNMRAKMGKCDYSLEHDQQQAGKCSKEAQTSNEKRQSMLK